MTAVADEAQADEITSAGPRKPKSFFNRARRTSGQACRDKSGRSSSTACSTNSISPTVVARMSGVSASIFPAQRRQEPTEHRHGSRLPRLDWQIRNHGSLIADKTALRKSLSGTDGGLAAQQAVPQRIGSPAVRGDNVGLCQHDVHCSALSSPARQRWRQASRIAGDASSG